VAYTVTLIRIDRPPVRQVIDLRQDSLGISTYIQEIYLQALAYVEISWRAGSLSSAAYIKRPPESPVAMVCARNW
jgi:hypothetical protein